MSLDHTKGTGQGSSYFSNWFSPGWAHWNKDPTRSSHYPTNLLPHRAEVARASCCHCRRIHIVSWDILSQELRALISRVLDCSRKIRCWSCDLRYDTGWITLRIGTGTLGPVVSWWSCAIQIWSNLTVSPWLLCTLQLMVVFSIISCKRSKWNTHRLHGDIREELVCSRRVSEDCLPYAQGRG